ncbi:MAG: GMC oxidoreductase, partial [Bryobacteraceae bacterium]
SISGSDEPSPSPRSTPYPQPPHRYSVLAKLLKDAFPEEVFPQPTARARLAVRNQRPACCSNNVCHHCPIDAKFTVLNGMKSVFTDPRVNVRFESKMERVEYAGNRATAVVYTSKDKPMTEIKIPADLVVLGANAIFNPYLLMRSGIHHPELGKGLVEQVSVPVFLELDGVNNFAGSTIVAGHGYMLYAGEHRRKRAGALMQINNRVQVSPSRGRWISRGSLLFTFEDLRQPENQVSVSPEDPQKPVVSFRGRSSYSAQGVRELDAQLGLILGRLPVRKYVIGPTWPTESHIMGTTVMGGDPRDSIVDQDGVHHAIRNIVVLGSGTFPTASPANPTLTICAHALRSADRLAGRAL